MVIQPDLKLCEYLLDKYNNQLTCGQCNRKYTRDGTAFIRDQGGKQGNLSYRKYRCKGKALRLCYAQYTPADFLVLVRETLGDAIIADARIVCNAPTPAPILRAPRRRSSKRHNFTEILAEISKPTPPKTPPRSNKREKDGSPSGLTPTSKRIDHTNKDDAEIIHLRRQLEIAQIEIQQLKMKANETRSDEGKFQEGYLPLLAELGTNRSPLALTQFFQSSVEKSLSPTIHTPPSPLAIVASPSPPTYTDVILDSLASDPEDHLASPPARKDDEDKVKKTLFKGPRRHAEDQNSVKMLYLLNVPFKKIGMVRTYLRSKGLYLEDLVNVSWIGRKVLECMVRESGAKQFRKVANRHGFGCLDTFDPTDPHDPNWKIIVDGDIPSRSVLNSEFIQRIANESVGSNDPLTGRMYGHWAVRMGKKDEFDKAVNERRKVDPLAIVADI